MFLEKFESLLSAKECAKSKFISLGFCPQINQQCKITCYCYVPPTIRGTSDSYGTDFREYEPSVDSSPDCRFTVTDPWCLHRDHNA